ncbi:redoxin domain-containing protein [Roseateles asaccharophilus]|uniref:Thioredoxin domain-containing protein n=1 Tax=Roseateles asaccharophilus TaxID=582607 RepID=A0ABU2A6B9_9BURK|nr:redoxin domain-containing protein [Roseateles asaccharophilus]MDR7332158.1 hypothetical protein [Roseateles asaccharophilus]
MVVSHPTDARPAPPLQVEHWLNTPRPISLQDLRGRVVALHAFQMLCPGCVAHGLPQAARMHEMFPASQLAVIGLHTVFEHHEVMQPRVALEAFIHEYRLAFPIGIDKPDPRGGGVPLTMQSLGLRGTPSLILLDKRGRIRLHHFGRSDDLSVGALIGQLIAEPDPDAAPGCDEDGCRLPDAMTTP